MKFSNVVLISLAAKATFVQAQCSGTSWNFNEDDFEAGSLSQTGKGSAGPTSTNEIDVNGDGMMDIQLTYEILINSPGADASSCGTKTSIGAGWGGTAALTTASDFASSTSNDCICTTGIAIMTVDFLNGFHSDATNFAFSASSQNGFSEAYEFGFGFVSGATDSGGNTIAGLNAQSSVTSNYATYCTAEYDTTTISSHILSSATGVFTTQADNFNAGRNNCATSTESGEDTTHGSGPNSSLSTGVSGLSPTDLITQVTYVYGLSNAVGTDCDADGFTAVRSSPSGSISGIAGCFIEQTEAPVTPAPVTPAPVTPAPITQAPVTPAPVTPAPVTPAPVTPAPVTPAPVTPAPVTPAPVAQSQCLASGTSIFFENFQDELVGAQAGSASGLAWTASCPDCAPTSTADYFEVATRDGEQGIEGRDTNGPAPFLVEGIDLSSCYAVTVSFSYNTPGGYDGSGNLECAEECSGCTGLPEDVTNGSCNNCWDYLLWELDFGATSNQAIILGNDCTVPSEGTYTSDALCGEQSADVDLKIEMAMWAGSEYMFLDNIEICCYDEASAPPALMCNTPAPVTAAPVTPAPVTPAPVTPAPLTSAPVTPAPVTPAPITPAPVTQAPVTSAPVTPSPVTPAPVTQTQVTPAPVTPAPVTQALVTPAPVTQALVTPAPVTQSPVTPAPVTSSPITPAPVTLAPDSPAPITQSPVTSAPVTSSSITPAPVTPAPVTPAPTTQSPIAPAPITPSPVSSAPVTFAPVTPSPVTLAPITQSPVTPAPVTSNPLTPAPAVPDQCPEPATAYRVRIKSKVLTTECESVTSCTGNCD